MNITNIFFGLYENFPNSFCICYALKCIIYNISIVFKKVLIESVRIFANKVKTNRKMS